MSKRVGSMEIAQDMGFTSREWAVQRLGWVVMALLLLAALAGLFGVGPLAQVTLDGSDGLQQVQYDRYVRFKGPTALLLRLGPGAISEGEARVRIDRDYLDDLQIENVSPQPDAVEIAGDDLVYMFRVADATRPLDVRFSLQSQKLGRLHGRVGVAGGPMLDFGQIVYP